MMRRVSNKKSYQKTLYDLTQEDLETLLDASMKYNNLLIVYKKELKQYNDAIKNVEKQLEPLSGSMYHITEKYNDLYYQLYKHEVGFFESIYRDTFKYEERFGWPHKYKTWSLSISAKPITLEMDKLLSELSDLNKQKVELEKNLTKALVPKKPVLPQVSALRPWLSSFKLSECTPTKIRYVMEQTNQSQDLKAKATAYDNKQRQEAGTIKRKIVSQIYLFPCCPYCGDGLSENDAHADHIYPVSKGGQSTIRNMVFVCTKCNLKKRDLTLRNFITKYDLNGDFIHKNLDILGKDF